ncbi:hypothetical protein Q0F98_36140 [Paenibacillus amylolyticus]|nr:hypothetical protein Q0F98_36140 [Paenibacillus amylolyticus]
MKLGQEKKQTTMVFRLIQTADLTGKAVRILTHPFDLTEEETGPCIVRWNLETFYVGSGRTVLW